METIDINKLTPEQKRQLSAQLQAEQEAEKKALKENREAYKRMVADTVPEMFRVLASVNDKLQDSKKRVFEMSRDLIDLKKDAYEVKEGQQSHSFTSEDGKQSITIGFRVNDGWDDTLPTGMEKVKQFLQGRSKDKESQEMVEGINILLKKDKNGNLKSSRVIELNQWAEKIGNDLLKDGVRIIMDAYKPVKTCYFIEASYTDGTGKKQSMPLSISTVDFPEGTQIDFM